MMNNTDAVTCRWALEALRNGVPNKQAVKLLGSNQTRAQERFSELLSRVVNRSVPPSAGLGMLVSGDFGTGKSHLLSHLEHEALERGFVCSRVAISKETPLFKLDKVYKSAIDHGRTLHATGRLMEEIGLRLNDKSSKSYDDFSNWANSENSGLHQIFPATLMIHERLNDFDYNNDIESFWSGDRIGVARVKEGLSAINQQHSYSFRSPRVNDLPPQRLRFATELIKGAGYNGWVVLLDEIELVGSYSLLQRAKSYAELTRWMGQAADEKYPGLVVVATVTDDFESAVLGELGKQDLTNAAPRLHNSNQPVLAARAETGMRIIQRDAVRLAPPSESDLNTTMERLRQIYTAAYGWDAPPLEVRTGGAGYQNRMRYKVRSAINQWDLLRLYPGSQPETEETEFHFNYEENTDLEREAKDDPA